jgi:hypothetical protein
MSARRKAVLITLFFLLSAACAGSQPAGDFSASVSKDTTIRAADFTSAAKIASFTGEVSPENICLSLGRFSDDPDWFIDMGGTTVRFVGEGRRDITFIVVCDLSERITSTIQENPSTRMSLKYVSHCRQFFEGGTQVQCAVILNSATAPPQQSFPLPYIILIAFAVLLIWPMLLAITSDNGIMKLIYLMKLVIFAVTLFLFTLFGSRESTFFNLVLLSSFFLQANLSLSTFLLGILREEKKHVKLSNFAILGIELTIILFMLAVIWQSGAFGL